MFVVALDRHSKDIGAKALLRTLSQVFYYTVLCGFVAFYESPIQPG